MGKKRVAQKTGDINKNRNTAGQSQRFSSTGITSKRKIDNGRVYINATYNNTMITVTDKDGNSVAWSSSGSLGFSGPKKATPFAASKVVSAVVDKIKRYGPFNICIFVRGIGGGRNASIREFAAQGFNILSIKDVTPIPHNGPRRKKPRRV